MTGAGDGAAGGDPGRLRIHAVVDPGWRGRARGVLGGDGDEGSREGGVVKLRGRDVSYRLVAGEEAAAVVTSAGAAEGDEGLLLHARVVEALLDLPSVVPVPERLEARDEDAVRRLMERARVPLREALERFEGCYEVRLHVTRRAGSRPEPAEAPARGAGADAGAADAPAAEGLFRQLRFRARSARRLATSPERVLTGAFLVPREEWIGFVEEASRAGERRPGIETDVTGPWAPYDFVRFLPEGPPEGGTEGA